MFLCWLFTMLFASFRCCVFGLFPVTSCCEDSFDYVRLSSSWTRSSSLRDFRQDDHTLEITTIFAMLVCPLFCYANAPMPTFCLSASQLPCWTSNPPCPSKPLIGYVTALLSPSYSVASCRWRLEAVPCWNIYLLVGISLYYYVILMHLYTW